MIIMLGAVTHTLLGNVRQCMWGRGPEYNYPEWMGRGVRNSFGARIEACTELNLGNEAIC